MSEPRWRERWPGYVATSLLVLVTTLWVFWGVSEMFYEGWWGAWYNRLPYLVPGIVCLLITFLTLAWPRAGGWLLIAIGGGFTAWWWGMAALRHNLTWRRALGQLPVSGLLVLVGLLFLRHAALRRREQRAPDVRWWQRNRRYLIALGIPLLVALGITAVSLPTVLSRVDDGRRDSRLVAGNGVTLVWAPAGPGWNWQQSWGGYPAWSDIALYGAEPVGVDKELQTDATSEDMARTGLCRYLSSDGTTLLDTPQDIWRLPTTDELVRSPVRHGDNAGCVWNGELGRADCAVRPDKETPLWATDAAPIYYWTADEFDRQNAYFVSYNGRVGVQPKSWGNSRHGYRCVRRP